MVDTPNYGYTIPDVGASLDVWGDVLNDNWTDLDGDLKTVDNDAIARSGVNTTNIDANAAAIIVNADAITVLTDALNATNAALIAQQIKVGGLYISTVADDPNTSLGYGTWVADALGRSIVGVGDNGDSEWDVGRLSGSETHILTEAQMPRHGHPVGQTDNTGLGGAANRVTGSGSDIDTGLVGNDAAHNNIQPSKSFYVWRRTA
jgi:hypothetical protein